MTNLWQLTVEVPPSAVPAFELALSDDAVAVTAMEQAGRDDWRIDILFGTAPDADALDRALEGAARAAGIARPEVRLEILGERDWVGENQRLLAPLALGRFWVHGEHDRGRVPPGRIGLEIEASIAFGTGRHATTAGCLDAIEGLSRARRFRRPLDVGCGSGVLAMAAARVLAVPVVASDIDPASVRVAAANVRANGLLGRVRTLVAEGVSAREIQAGAPYDLILANILAKPLTRLAAPIAKVLAPGGRVVLSGLLETQERQVLAAYGLVGLRLERRIARDGWHTLVLAPRGKSPGRRPRTATR